MADINKLVKKDKIIEEGFRYRKIAANMIVVSTILTLFFLVFGNVYLDAGLLLFILIGFRYKMLFDSWEKKNAEYLRSLGFDVKVK